MSTRTTGKRETLEERVKRRPIGVWPFHQIVRAEYDLLARRVRKLYRTQGQFYGDGTCVRLNDVLAIIKERKK